MGEPLKPLHLVPPPSAEEPADAGKTVSRGQLVNRLNRLNFQDLTLLVRLRHKAYDDTVYLKARPLPCEGERLDCAWAEVKSLAQLLASYQLDYLLIPDGKKYLLVTPELIAMNPEGLSVNLPLSCREFQVRKIRRHAGEGVAVQLIQHGALFNGELVDFTPEALRAEGSGDSPSTFLWINPETPANVRLARGGEMLFSGAFEIVWQSYAGRSRTFVLRQANDTIHRFRNKLYRNRRQVLVPSPNIVFEHPLIGKRVNLKIVDVSGSGFSVEENESDSVLLLGLIIPKLKISFAQGLSLNCMAQVVARKVLGEEGGRERTVRCGLAILDMEIHDHVRLLSVLHQVADRKTYVAPEVDLDDLWDFFFETGFVYPGKYARFQANKQEIKETYARLYGDNPHIARHFIYQDRGAILGHLAMVRFFRDAWMIHHHAARKAVTIRAGVAVLEQVGHYLNELANFYFAHLRYVYCYYRPDNKFPSRVFGGFAREEKDPAACSLDRFAFSHFRAEEGGETALPEGWELSPAKPFDFSELGSFYRYVSGGLMLRAFELEEPPSEPDELAQEYRAIGFRKEKYCYALKSEGALRAFLLVNCTNAGFNMADLTNCVSVLVLDPELTPELLTRALAQVSVHYEDGRMPLLTYPVSWLELNAIPYDKIYLLWILNLDYMDDYFQYSEQLFRSAGKTTREG